MYGKYVTVTINDIEMSVYIFCNPNTTDKELQSRAKKLIKNALKSV